MIGTYIAAFFDERFQRSINLGTFEGNLKLIHQVCQSAMSFDQPKDGFLHNRKNKHLEIFLSHIDKENGI